MERQIVNLVKQLDKIAKENKVSVYIQSSVYDDYGVAHINRITEHKTSRSVKYIDGIEISYSEIAKYPEVGEQE